MGDLVVFPVVKVQRLRSRASRAARVPRSVPQGWSVNTVGPEKVLGVFSALRLKQGFVLRAYQFREGNNGNAFVWALPAEAKLPAPEDCPRLEEVFLEPARPPSALEDIMDAIEGDGTPWSYLSASMLKRELAEFGAMWHGCDWSTHALLGGVLGHSSAENSPFDGPQTPADDWTWLQPPPSQWLPEVQMKEASAIVTFHTYSGLGQESIFKHTDTYSSLGCYGSARHEEAIATGQGGFTF
jgi:hypothetical protein